MKQRPLQSTLREMQAVLRLRNLWVTFAAVVLLFTVTGPFGSAEHLRSLPRLAYWFVIHALAWPTAIAFAIAGKHLLPGRRLPVFARMLAGSALSALPIAASIELVDYAWFARVPGMAGLMTATVSTLPLCLIFCVISYMTLAAETKQDGTNDPAPSPDAMRAPPGERLLQRLKPDNRGALLHLSVEDHYTRVRTSRGSELILMRFSDALRDIEDVDGLRIHRSHWVAAAFVSGLERSEGRLAAILHDGSHIPVSRTYAAEVRERFG